MAGDPQSTPVDDDEEARVKEIIGKLIRVAVERVKLFGTSMPGLEQHLTSEEAKELFRTPETKA